MEKVEQQAKAEANEKAPPSLIGADVVITGNIEASLALQVEGRIKGDVRCSTLVIGENASIDGNVHAERVRVQGSVDGGVDAKDLAVEATGRVAGDISYERIKIASGAVVEGSMRCKTAEAKRGETSKLKLVDTPVAATNGGREPDHVFIE